MSSEISPMPPFDWQENLWRDFCKRVAQGSMPHALLLMGREGIGVEELAFAMGQYLLCLSPLDQLACGRCRGCQLNRVGTHPDLSLISPQEGAKVIKVDQIREMTAIVGQTAQQGGRKVILLQPAEAMNTNAANALLKNLEEPAGATIFILVAYQLHRLLPTIRSRCLKLAVPPPAPAPALAWLNAQGIPDAQALLDEVQGAPVLAKRWHDSGVLQTRQELLRDLVALGEQRLEPMQLAKKWSQSEPEAVLLPMLSSVESALLQHLGGRQAPEPREAVVRKLLQCPPNYLYRLRDQLIAKRAQLQGAATLNAALYIEELCLDWDAVLGSARRQAKR